MIKGHFQKSNEIDITEQISTIWEARANKDS